ncbi:MAG: response regulator transcription factor [Alphaproteobacteria bacterium]
MNFQVLHKQLRLLFVSQREGLSSYLVLQLLENEDCVIELADGYDSAITRAVSSVHDAVLVDFDMLGSITPAVCRRLRSGLARSPVLALSKFGSDEEVIQAFDAGVTDYIAKPISSVVLLARIRAHVRDFEESGIAPLRLGPLVFWPVEKLVKDTATGVEIRLSGKEASLLKYLYQNRFGWVDTRSVLADVWRLSPHVSTHTVETHIYRLRRKLESNPADPELLLRSSQGYRLCLDRKSLRQPVMSVSSEMHGGDNVEDVTSSNDARHHLTAVA